MSEIVNIPDENFRNCILQILKKPSDCEITQYDCESIINLSCIGLNIKYLSGIEYFTNLKVLECNRNQLKSLDLCNNRCLNELYCSYNKLTSLNLNKNIVLNTLFCYGNQLTSLDLSKNIFLKDVFYYTSNNVSNLKLNNNIKKIINIKDIITNFNNLTIQI